MALLQTLASQISSRSQSRGRSYFLTGAVRSLTAEHGIVRASVRGTTIYQVWLEPMGTLLRASCTCPYFVDHLEICKHVWAVILAADAQGIPLVAFGIASRQVVIDPVHPDEEMSDVDEAFDEPLPEPRHAAPLLRGGATARLGTYEGVLGRLSSRRAAAAGVAPAAARCALDAGAAGPSASLAPAARPCRHHHLSAGHAIAIYAGPAPVCDQRAGDADIRRARARSDDPGSQDEWRVGQAKSGKGHTVRHTRSSGGE